MTAIGLPALEHNNSRRIDDCVSRWSIGRLDQATAWLAGIAPLDDDPVSHALKAMPTELRVPLIQRHMLSMANIRAAKECGLTPTVWHQTLRQAFAFLDGFLAAHQEYTQ